MQKHYYICSNTYYMRIDETPYSIRLSKALKSRLEAKAFEKEIKTPDLIRQILKDYISASDNKIESGTTPPWSSEEIGRYMELSKKLFGNVNGQ